MWVAGGAAIVLAAVALVVAALAESDRRSVRPRRVGTVTADELRGADLPVAWRGYDRGHVDALLARAATTLEDVQRYGAVGEPTDAGLQAPAERMWGRPPSFLAGAVSDPTAGGPATSEDPDEAPSDEAPSGEAPSGEELEDRGGDDAGGLDR